jgi:hypothetical protein
MDYQQLNQIIQQRMQEQGIQLPQGAAANAQNSSPAQPTETEASLNEKVAAFPAKNQDLQFVDRKDGFDVNGQPFMDAEGRIVKYSFDVLTGDVTYLVQTAGNNYSVKYVRAGSDIEGVTIGYASTQPLGWQVRTVTGKKLAGELMTLLPKGVLISRDSAAFKYVPGNGVTNIGVPQGYIIAPFQHGNIGATDFVLLEKVEENSTSPIGGIFSSLKAIGNDLGINKKEDYALLGLKDKKLYLLNIASNGKEVNSYSNCRKQNNMVNNCATMTSQESLYDGKTGGRNTGHYFWRTNWFNTSAGPIAVAMENGMKDITLTDLTTGKKFVAFTRTMGIVRFDAAQDSSGKVKIVAQVGFSSETIDDAVEFMKTAPEVKNETEKVSQAAQ